MAAAIFPISAAAASIPNPSSYLDGYRRKLMDFIHFPKTVIELYESMNRVLGYGPSTRIYWSVTGESYIEYTAITQNNDRAEELLCRFMWDTFRRQVGNLIDVGNARIYWRIKPEFAVFRNQTSYALDWNGSMEEPTNRIYLRYLISEKPILVSSDHDPESALLDMAHTNGWKMKDSVPAILHPLKVS